MKIVLDTNVFWNPKALQELSNRTEDVVVPAVVVAERARQLRRDRDRDAKAFVRQLEDMDFIIEPMGPSEAIRYTEHLADKAWKKHARDALIAGHVGPTDELWTSNVKDFVEVGVPESQIRKV